MLLSIAHTYDVRRGSMALGSAHNSTHVSFAGSKAALKALLTRRAQAPAAERPVAARPMLLLLDAPCVGMPAQITQHALLLLKCEAVFVHGKGLVAFYTASELSKWSGITPHCAFL